MGDATGKHADLGFKVYGLRLGLRFRVRDCCVVVIYCQCVVWVLGWDLSLHPSVNWCLFVCFLGIVRLAFPLFDQSLYLFISPVGAPVGPVLAPRAVGPMQVALLQMTIFLVVRDPTFVTASLACLAALILSFAFLFLPDQKSLGSFLTVVVAFLFVAFTSRAFYTRSIDNTRTSCPLVPSLVH